MTCEYNVTFSRALATAANLCLVMAEGFFLLSFLNGNLNKERTQDESTVNFY